MNTDKGFLILAHGKPFYLKWAYNLALSIKYFTDIPVALVTDLDVMRSPYNCYDIIIEVNDLLPFHAKTRLPEFTPFEETIYLDADSLCINDPSGLFDQDQEIKTHVYTPWKYEDRDKCTMIWANLSKLWSYYKIDPDHFYPETNSSIIYFRKTSKVRQFFDLAEILYAEKPFPDYDRTTFAYYPDELAFNTAYSLCGLVPGWNENESPIYFHGNTHGIMDVKNVMENRKFISLYGVDSTHGMLYKLYDRLKNEMFSSKYSFHGVKIKREMKAVRRSGNYPRHRPFRDHDENQYLELLKSLKEWREVKK